MEPSVKIISLSRGLTAWVLSQRFYYCWEHAGEYFRLPIPAGFLFDGASVPWFLRWVAGRGRFGLVAPLVHDWLHDQHGRPPVEHSGICIGWVGAKGRMLWSRRDADRMFFRILREQNVRPKWLRRAAFKLVRAWSLLCGDRWK